MDEDMDLENRLRRLPATLVLSAGDEAALGTLRSGRDALAPADAAQRRRRARWRRGAAIPVALVAVMAVGAVAFGDSASVVLHFRPVDPHTAGGSVRLAPVVTAPGGEPECAILPQGSVPDLQRRVGFRILTDLQPGARLVSLGYRAPCATVDGTVELIYESGGVSVVLQETRAPAGPVEIGLKDDARSSWRTVTVNGNDYAVQVLNGAVTVAAFKRAGTRVDVALGVKGRAQRPMTLQEFESLAGAIN
jgi:hypothetical protein